MATPWQPAAWLMRFTLNGFAMNLSCDELLTLGINWFLDIVALATFMWTFACQVAAVDSFVCIFVTRVSHTSQIQTSDLTRPLMDLVVDSLFALSEAFFLLSMWVLSPVALSVWLNLWPESVPHLTFSGFMWLVNVLVLGVFPHFVIITNLRGIVSTFYVIVQEKVENWEVEGWSLFF